MINPEIPAKVHPDDKRLFERVKRCAVVLSRERKLNLWYFEHKRQPRPNGSDGRCYTEDRRVAVVFRYRNPMNHHDPEKRGRWWKEPLGIGRILWVTAHEMAHLRYPDHGKRFKALEEDLRPRLWELYENRQALLAAERKFGLRR